MFPFSVEYLDVLHNWNPFEDENSNSDLFLYMLRICSFIIESERDRVGTVSEKSWSYFQDWVHGMRYADIGRKYGVTTHTAMTCVKRILMRIRPMLETAMFAYFLMKGEEQ